MAKKEDPPQPVVAKDEPALTVKSEIVSAPAASTAVEEKVAVGPVPSPSTREPLDETASPEKKKKKKKTSYKSMMAGMLEGSGAKDLEKEKEKLRDGMGGGHFKKIDHI